MHHAHRISGVAVVCFLLLHIVDVTLIRIDPLLYEDVHQLYGNIFLRVFEVGLFAGLVFHALNGLRIIAIEISAKVLRHDAMLRRGIVGFTIVATCLGGIIIVWPWVERFVS